MRFTHAGRKRLVEPRYYGIGTRGTEFAARSSARGRNAAGALFDVAKIRDLVVFTRPGPNYTRDDSAMATIFAQL